VDTSVIAFDGETLAATVGEASSVRCWVHYYTCPRIAYVSYGTPAIVAAVDAWLDAGRPDVTKMPPFDVRTEVYFGVVVKPTEVFTIIPGGLVVGGLVPLSCKPILKPTIWPVWSGWGLDSTLTCEATPGAGARQMVQENIDTGLYGWPGRLESVDVRDIYHGFDEE
jgi:hypothetical protein